MREVSCPLVFAKGNSGESIDGFFFGSVVIAITAKPSHVIFALDDPFPFVRHLSTSEVRFTRILITRDA